MPCSRCSKRHRTCSRGCSSTAGMRNVCISPCSLAIACSNPAERMSRRQLQAPRLPTCMVTQLRIVHSVVALPCPRAPIRTDGFKTKPHLCLLRSLHMASNIVSVTQHQAQFSQTLQHAAGSCIRHRSWPLRSRAHPPMSRRSSRS